MRSVLLSTSHHAWATDIGQDGAIDAFTARIESEQVNLDGVVLMPPQPHADDNPLPTPDVWRDLFQVSFIGPLALLKGAMSRCLQLNG